MKTTLDNQHPAGPQNQVCRHPIQVVSRRTGLSNDVIRAWERRYGVVEPGRQETGRRLYSDADIHRLALLQKVTSAGRRISEVAGMENAELEKLVEEDRQNESGLTSLPPSGRGPLAYVDEALQEITNINPTGLRQVLVRASADLPLIPFLEQVVTVLLRKIGEAWQDGSLRIGHEHFASGVIRRFLVGMLGTMEAGGPVIVIATPAGQRHEMGALMVAIVAESEGWRPLYLGADLPAREIAAVVNQSKARALGLSMQSRIDKNLVVEELEQLALALPESFPLIVGGRAVADYQLVISKAGAHMPVDFTEFVNVLASL